MHIHKPLIFLPITYSESFFLIESHFRYNDNMQKLSDAFKDRPMTPQQSVIYWTEYIIRHNGAPHLKISATQLNWFQYLLLDVLSFVTISTIFILYLVFRFFKILIHQFYGMKRKFQKNYKNKDI